MLYCMLLFYENTDPCAQLITAQKKAIQTKQQGAWKRSPNTNLFAVAQKKNCLLHNYVSNKECLLPCCSCDISGTNLVLQPHLADPSLSRRGLHAEYSLFIQVQSRRIYRPCGVQIHTVLHHTLGKRSFDSWFLAQLDGSYLFSDSSLCFSKPKQ